MPDFRRCCRSHTVATWVASRCSMALAAGGPRPAACSRSVWSRAVITRRRTPTLIGRSEQGGSCGENIVGAVEKAGEVSSWRGVPEREEVFNIRVRELVRETRRGGIERAGIVPLLLETSPAGPPRERQWGISSGQLEIKDTRSVTRKIKLC